MNLTTSYANCYNSNHDSCDPSKVLLHSNPQLPVQGYRIAASASREMLCPAGFATEMIFPFILWFL